MIPHETITQLIEQADIVDIIGQYVTLQKKGHNYWSLCPFHDDKAPSFCVSPDKKIYKCFSCGVQGNIIDFVKNYTHSEFLAALEIVSEKANFLIPELKNQVSSSKYTSKEEKLFTLNEKALQFYQVVLASKDGLQAQEYLFQRGFDRNETMFWEIGWASGKISLHKNLLDQNYNLDDLREAGLISFKDGEVFDYFVNRLIFPIKNGDGRILGFSGRTLTDQTPKYLNTRETSIFKKSQLIFNIDKAPQAANMQKKLLVLEGFMDVMSLHRFGTKNAIALMGTNLSDFHIQLFRKMNVEIQLFLDGDLPGAKASLKISRRLLEQQIKVSVIDNPTTFDPDELVQRGDTEILNKILENPQSPLMYTIHKLALMIDLNKPEILKEYLDLVFSFLSFVKEPIFVAQAFKALNETTALKDEVLEKSYELFSNKRKAQSIKVKPNYSKTNKIQNTAYDYSQRDILQSLIMSPKNLKKIEKYLEFIPDPDLHIILQELIHGYQTDTYHANNWKELMTILEYSSFSYENPFWQLKPENQLKWYLPKTLDSAFLALQEHHLKTKEALYAQQIRETNVVEAQMNFLKVKEEIHQQIIDLRKKRQ